MTLSDDVRGDFCSLHTQFWDSNAFPELSNPQCTYCQQARIRVAVLVHHCTKAIGSDAQALWARAQDTTCV